MRVMDVSEGVTNGSWAGARLLLEAQARVTDDPWKMYEHAHRPRVTGKETAEGRVQRLEEAVSGVAGLWR